MIDRILVLTILLDDTDSGASMEKPSFGLFHLPNQGMILSYATDKYDGYYSYSLGNLVPIQDIIPSAQGFLTTDGIGAITESGDFKNGGGRLLQSPVKFKLNNTGGLQKFIDDRGYSLTGRVCYITEISKGRDSASAAGHLVGVTPLFCGKIDQISWDETLLMFSAVPSWHQERDANLSVDGLPLLFGYHTLAQFKRISTPYFITNGDLGIEDDDPSNALIEIGSVTRDNLYVSTQDELSLPTQPQQTYTSAKTSPISGGRVREWLKDKFGWDRSNIFTSDQQLFLRNDQSPVLIRVTSVNINLVGLLHVTTEDVITYKKMPTHIELIFCNFRYSADGWPVNYEYNSALMTPLNSLYNAFPLSYMDGDKIRPLLMYGPAKVSPLSGIVSASTRCVLDLQPYLVEDVNLAAIMSRTECATKCRLILAI